MAPFPNTRAIPRRLAEYLAPTVLTTFNSVVEVRHPDTQGTRDSATGRTPFAELRPYYSGPGRAQGSPAAPATEGPAGKQLASAGFLIAVPYRVREARAGDIVRVLSGGDDPALIGVWLRVVGIGKADIILQRNLQCELYEQAARGSR